ncbi:MAG: DNA mismatch repair endonuclease MutL [bacterium]
MTSRIRVLPDDLINRIAAGEVVERPFSVVKELVENALDAGASRVSVELSGGGKEWIQVTDDGSGMSGDELALALTRHATSKLAGAEDLDAIATLGFRGEALPSIAAVSRLEIVSRRADDLAGHRIRVEGGRLQARGEAGAPPGTRVVVSDLFFNTPARRAFLKADGTELRHVADWMQRLALARPAVTFTLVHESRTLLEAPAASTLTDRVLAVLGRDVAVSMHQVDGMEGDAALHGLIAKPGVTRPTASAHYVDVNGRVIRDRGLIHAVLSGYGSLNPAGRYPIVVLRLEIPLDAVDVNVHPAKTEVRFRDAAAIHRLVHHAVRDGLKMAPWIGANRERGELGDREAAEAPLVSVPFAPLPAAPAPAAEREGFAAFVGRDLPGWTLRERPEPATPAPTSAPEDRSPSAPSEPGRSLGEGFFGSLRPIGQLHRTYLVCEGGGGLVLIDQHAAHERVTFERLRAQCLGGTVAVQELLIPESLEVGPVRAQLAAERAPLLERLGFGLEPFGGGAVLVKHIPALLVQHGELARLVSELLDADEGLAAPAGAASSAALEEVLGRMACHGSVRAGRVLSLDEMRELLRALDQTDFRGNCPHGRNVILELPIAEIERRVGRR